MKLITPIPLLILTFALFGGTGISQDDLKPYASPKESQVRHVVRLPVLEKGEEENRKIEIVVSKTEMLDSVNRYFYGGKIEQKTVQGWGYSYYELEKVGPLAGTRMAAPPGSPKVKRKVRVNGGLDLLRYNSKLPVVVYTPEGFDVEVRIWSAGDALQAKPE